MSIYSIKHNQVIPMLIALVISGGMGLACVVLGVIKADEACRLKTGATREWIRVSQVVTKMSKPEKLWTDSPGRSRSVSVVKAKLTNGDQIFIVTPSDVHIENNGWLKISSNKLLELPKNLTKGLAVYVYSKHPLRDVVIQLVGLVTLAILSLAVLLVFFRNCVNRVGPSAPFS